MKSIYGFRTWSYLIGECVKKAVMVQCCRDQGWVKLSEGGQDSQRKQCGSLYMFPWTLQPISTSGNLETLLLTSQRGHSVSRKRLFFFFFLVNQHTHTLISNAFEHACQVVVPASESCGSYEDAIFAADQFVTAMRLYKQARQSAMKTDASSKSSLQNFSWHLLKITRP